MTPQRTIISHREFADGLSDTEPPVAERDGEGDGEDDHSTKPAEPVNQQTAKPVSASPVGAHSVAKPKSKSATPKPATATKPAKSANPKAPKARKAASTTSTKSKTTWAGETGPDNAITVDGEQQWEISDIVGQEGDILLVKWKGWKGVWEEDRAVIAESAPELVKAWEDRVEQLAKAKAAGGRKKRGPKKAATAGAGKGKAMTARKAATKTAGGKGRPKKVVAPKKGPKVTKSPKKATAPKSPKKAATKPKATGRRGRTAKAK